jgi:uncharacterized protein YndB with AHSA1/START domain
VNVEPEGEEPVEVETRVQASPDVVFSFFTDPDKYCRWQGRAAELDPRPGGRYRVDMDGTNVVLGEYIEVDPPNRVVFTCGFEGNQGLPPGASMVEVTLLADGDGTIVRLRHTRLPDQDTRAQHRAGWEQFLERLAIAGASRDAASGGTAGG